MRPELRKIKVKSEQKKIQRIYPEMCRNFPNYWHFEKGDRVHLLLKNTGGLYLCCGNAAHPNPSANSSKVN